MGTSPTANVYFSTNALDGLDDVFDRKPGANVWLWRLLLATRDAMAGSRWEKPLSAAAEGLQASFRQQNDPEVGNEQALTATDGLRRMLAEAL